MMQGTMHVQDAAAAPVAAGASAEGAAGGAAGHPERDYEDRLDDPVAPPFAPVRGHDPRLSMPKAVLRRRPVLFVLKFGFAAALIALCWFVIAARVNIALSAAAVLAVGCLYAHLIELQHECLHRHSFASRRLCDVFGFLCGIPMISSNAHYRHDHLRHHAHIGTDDNHEFFNYRLVGLDHPIGFLRAACHMGRYIDVLRDVWASFVGGPIRGAGGLTVRGANPDRAIRREYQLYCIIVLAAVGYTVAARDPLVLVAWFLPLFVAEPVHFLIELPEHYGLNTQNDGHVFSNTRTIRAGWLGYWFTNGNNLHTAHHYHQGVPMSQMPALQRLIEDRLEEVETSYWSFFRKVLNGTLQNHPENCMSR